MRINKKKKQQPNSQSIIQPQSKQQSFASPSQTDQAADLQAMQEQAQQPGMNFGDISVFSADQSPSPIPIQAKLTIGQPNDKYEQEADQVASQVVQSINSPEANQPVQRTQEEEEVQMKPLHLQADGATAEASAAPPEIEHGINQAKAGGQALAPNLQQKMGSAMGADFSGVRVHTDNKADKLNESIQAKAFTTGRDVFFKQGAYQPGNQEGQKLIAHELTHVVQQNSNAVQCQREGVIQRYIIKRNGRAGKSIASVKEAIDFLTKNGISSTLAMVIALQAKRARQEVSLADMLRDGLIAKRQAAALTG